MKNTTRIVVIFIPFLALSITFSSLASNLISSFDALRSLVEIWRNISFFLVTNLWPEDWTQPYQSTIDVVTASFVAGWRAWSGATRKIPILKNQVVRWIFAIFVYLFLFAIALDVQPESGGWPVPENLPLLSESSLAIWLLFVTFTMAIGFLLFVISGLDQSLVQRFNILVVIVFMFTFILVLEVNERADVARPFWSKISYASEWLVSDFTGVKGKFSKGQIPPIEVTSSKVGKFNGPLQAEVFINSGNKETRLRLLKPFSYTDATGKVWTVPSGWVVNGASIPKYLWSFVGAPFSGPHLEASVIHDYHCEVRTESWISVHRLFYEGLIASGVETSKAKYMYAAVHYFGPRWIVDDNSHAGRKVLDPFKLSKVRRAIEEDTNISLEEIEAMD